MTLIKNKIKKKIVQKFKIIWFKITIFSKIIFYEFGFNYPHNSAGVCVCMGRESGFDKTSSVSFKSHLLVSKFVLSSSMRPPVLGELL